MVKKGYEMDESDYREEERYQKGNEEEVYMPVVLLQRTKEQAGQK
jgi:hypothetical protein